MTIDISLVPGPVRAVPRAGVPFAPVPPAASPRCPASRPLPPPPDVRLPVMTVGGARPDRTGNVDLAPFLAAFAPLSHVSDPTVHHTASEIGDIAAAKVAEVVADAPDNLDTLKEIADVIGTEAGQAAGGILKRVADLEAGKAGKSEMSVTNGTDANADKTTIQLKTGTSATVLTAHQDVSGKLDGVAAYPAWSGSIGYRAGSIVSRHGRLWHVDDELVGGGTTVEEPDDTSGEWYEVFLKDLKQDALSPAQLAAANSGATAAKVATWDGYAAQIAAKASASDVNTALAQKASMTDLPYALVTPGEWEFSGLPSGVTVVSLIWENYVWTLTLSDQRVYGASSASEEETYIYFYAGGDEIVATKTGYHLLDRASNVVSVSSATTLTLPVANPDHMRDLYVRLSISASGAGSTVTWTVAQGETWDAMGAPPSTFAEGTCLYRLTEVAAGVWHCEDMLAIVGLEAALAGKIPMYPMVAVTPSSGTLTVTPYTVATYTAGTSAAAFTVAVGAGTTGKVRDCELVIDCAATGAVAPTVTWTATFHPRTDAGTDFACEAGVRNVYYISEYAPGEFVVGGWQETAGGSGT